MKVTMKYLIKRTESIFVDSTMIVLDLNDRKKRVHKGGGIGVWSYITRYGLGSLFIFDGRLNSIKYIDILEDHLSMALEKFPSKQLSKILYQHDNARPLVSAMTKEYLQKKNIIPIV